MKKSQINDKDNGVKETGAYGEGLSPGRCPIAAQDGPGRYTDTAVDVETGGVVGGGGGWEGDGVWEDGDV